MSDTQPTLGFIGIGLMGTPMSQRLLKAGFQVHVWNRSQEKLGPLAELGAHIEDNPGTVAQVADIVLLSLADTAVVNSITLGNQGLVDGGDGNTLICDTSSIEPEATKNIASELRQRCGAHWIDAPVSGGVAGAESGTLAVMAGGEEADFERLQPIMEHLSQRFTHMGDLGAGQITKVCNQMIVSCNALVIAEVIALARKAGIDASRIPEALAGGFADSKPLQILGPQMANDDFEPIKWYVRTLLKDLDTANLLSRDYSSATPMAGLGAQLMRQHATNGYLEKDPATLVELYRNGDN